MFKWLKGLFRPKTRDIREIISPDQVVCDDPYAREVIARAFNAPEGHFVIGRVDDDGNLQIEEKPMKPRS